MPDYPLASRLLPSQPIIPLMAMGCSVSKTQAKTTRCELVYALCEQGLKKKKGQDREGPTYALCEQGLKSTSARTLQTLPVRPVRTGVEAMPWKPRPAWICTPCANRG